MNKNEKKSSLTKKFVKVFKDANKKGVSQKEIRNIFGTKSENGFKKVDSGTGKAKENDKATTPKEPVKENKWISRRFSFLYSKYSMYALIYTFGILSAVITLTIKETITDMLADKCIIDHSLYASEMARPLVQCGMCKNLDSIPVEHAISAEDFNRKYAYSYVPVLIKDATSTWSAMSTFSYQYFKDLYQGTRDSLKTVEEDCLFFPYKTDFDTLSDVFNMSDKRANFEEGEDPWYIGWSNCHKEVRDKLRKHYERPYFLPNNSESSTLDWIFMGGSGNGAPVHLDYVMRPSWQAQISGKKTWSLVPTPECEAECKSFNVTVHKGDIFVVDTNVWYHSTFIHPGEISITIGSEYD
ncbi:uncharacterized protein LOC132724274 [Ruditapes philippinarum]|uniref:uncharacterized protein LOC132724274 n=1 Tax=Ruditapes philippinarum TaxID=129788 RepID=UPI00295B6084|nr:uncharacterized protein LOC132724274 [Ruditapes philippinarum]